jgi:hypothetical protein
MSDTPSQLEVPAIGPASRDRLRRAAALLAAAAGINLLDWAVPYVGLRLMTGSPEWFFYIQPWLLIAQVVLEAAAILPLVKPAVDPAMSLLPPPVAKAALIGMIARWSLVAFLHLHDAFGQPVSNTGMTALYALAIIASGAGVIAAMLCARDLARQVGAKALAGFVPLTVIAAAAYYVYELLRLLLSSSDSTAFPAMAMNTLRYAQPFHAITATILWVRCFNLNFDARPKDEDACFDEM